MKKDTVRNAGEMTNSTRAGVLKILWWCTTKLNLILSLYDLYFLDLNKKVEMERLAAAV